MQATADQKEEFIKFRESCIWLQNCFNIFENLYNSGDSTEATLRTVAPVFFSDLNIILQEYFFLQIRKISDPAGTNGRENMSLPFINKGLRESGLMTDEIEVRTKRMLAYREVEVEAANRVIAHADKHTALLGESLGAHEKSLLESFMQDLRDYTDAVGNAIGVGPLDYRTQAGPGDVQDLIRVLKRSGNPRGH